MLNLEFLLQKFIIFKQKAKNLPNLAKKFHFETLPYKFVVIIRQRFQRKTKFSKERQIFQRNFFQSKEKRNEIKEIK